MTSIETVAEGVTLILCPRCERMLPADGSTEPCHNEFCAEPYADIRDGHGNVIIKSRNPIPEGVG